MKKLLIISIGIFICFIGCKNAKHKIPDHVTLTWADDPYTTQTITWRTDTTELNGEIQYTIIDDSVYFESRMIKVKEDSCGKFKTDVGTWNLHKITIKGLKPGKIYWFKMR